MAAIHAQSFDRSWDALDMATHTQKDICLGVDGNDRLAAFVILSCASDQAEVLTIATRQSARREGFGAALLTGAATALRAQNVKELFLEVAEDNMGAIALYNAAGFTPIGRRPGYYHRANGRVSALTFSKKL